MHHNITSIYYRAALSHLQQHYARIDLALPRSLNLSHHGFRYSCELNKRKLVGKPCASALATYNSTRSLQCVNTEMQIRKLDQKLSTSIYQVCTSKSASSEIMCTVAKSICRQLKSRVVKTAIQVNSTVSKFKCSPCCYQFQISMTLYNSGNTLFFSHTST